MPVKSLQEITEIFFHAHGGQCPPYQVCDLKGEKMASDSVLVEKKGYVTTIVLNRPAKLNSLTPGLLIQLSQVIETLKHDGDTRALIIRGAGDKAFSAGYDIGSIPTTGAADPRQNPLEDALQSVMNFPCPVIAMLNGSAYGAGCELAVSCDFRAGGPGIRMGMPPAKLGIVYSPNGLMRFIRQLGFAKTREIFFTGRNYDSERAKEMGLIDYLVPMSELEQFTFGLAAEMAANSPLAVRGIKRILCMLATPVQLTEAQASEAWQLVSDSFCSEDLQEARSAFLGKRMPVFRGR
jgi:enoyl-CoA hydratase